MRVEREKSELLLSVRDLLNPSAIDDIEEIKKFARVERTANGLT